MYIAPHFFKSTCGSSSSVSLFRVLMFYPPLFRERGYRFVRTYPFKLPMQCDQINYFLCTAKILDLKVDEVDL